MQAPAREEEGEEEVEEEEEGAARCSTSSSSDALEHAAISKGALRCSQRPRSMSFFDLSALTAPALARKARG